ncbi:MAG: hypothetical protein ACI9F9_000389 [Candidatus Paceibacteria bacterium]|jgi:hypothetical protein
MESSLMKPASLRRGRVPVSALLILLACVVGGVALMPVSHGLTSGGSAKAGDKVDKVALKAARDTITEDEVLGHLQVLASAEFEGRDSPSEGLERAAIYLEEQLDSYGFRGVGKDGSFRVPFSRRMSIPDEARCWIKMSTAFGSSADESAVPKGPEFGVDFVPLPGCTGEAQGQAIYVGFGIDRKGYDDLVKKKLKGKIAVIIEGEPRHRRLFEGPDVVTEAADVYGKIEELLGKDVAGILVVRRPPATATLGPDGQPLAPPAMGFRYTWAQWNPGTTEAGPRRKRAFRAPVLEVTPELASAVLGEDVLALAARSDESGKPTKARGEGQEITISSGFDTERLDIDNVAGILEGTDPELRQEVVIVGAHYDHIGVDPRGRIAFGADDNGSGTVAMLEVAQAFASAPPRRSIVVAFFAGEEDGLLGSSSFAKDPPMPRENIAAMFNMDMVGRGESNEVVVLGTAQNPDLEEVLDQAHKIKGSGVRKIVTDQAAHLWQRSDHYSFHQALVPVLFFFEAVSENLNEDYHTFRDSLDLVDIEKVANTAKLCLHVAWIVANADERPGIPRNR